MGTIKEELKDQFGVEVVPIRGLIRCADAPTRRTIEGVKRFNMPSKKRRTHTEEDDGTGVSRKEARKAARTAVSTAPSAVCLICKRDQSATANLDEDSWISCEVCSMWMHLDCVHLTDVPENFICQYCAV